ncbi:MAG: multiprotein bridging factor aMBF1 [Candidatus Thermoplasmatota archaeon]
MPCEMCGCDKKGCRPAIIDGAKMLLCPECIQHAETVEETRIAAVHRKNISLQKPRIPEKDIYQQMQKELVSNWSEIIKKAREKKGLTREELGFRIGERTVTIQKLENGDLRPSDKMIDKLEKELNIQLLEEVKNVPISQHGTTGLTLGDFIRTKES